jgi:hypothetical protein
MRVFVSYRREDAPDATDRLTAALVGRFGRDNVFIDVDSIDIGADFATVIGDWVQRCDVVLAVIGRDWLDARSVNGERRLDNPGDYVRLEIEAGLDRGVRVVPVLLQGAQLPNPGTLPESLEPLLQRNAIELTRKHWELDVQDLLLALERFAKDRAERFAEEHGRWDAVARPPSSGEATLEPGGDEQRVDALAQPRGDGSDVGPTVPDVAAGPPVSGRVRASAPRRWSGSRVAACLAVLVVAGGGAAWGLSRSSHAKPTPTSSTTTSTTTSATTSASTSTTTSTTTSTAAAASPTTTLLQALRTLNSLGDTKGLLPPSTCRTQSADLVTCTDPSPQISAVSFHTYPTLASLYAAYTSTIRL